MACATWIIRDAVDRKLTNNGQTPFVSRPDNVSPISPDHTYHLARTLYCRTDLYMMVINYAERSLDVYNGVPFALSDAWAYFDSAAARDAAGSAELNC